jgi:hypothetical protein
MQTFRIRIKKATQGHAAVLTKMGVEHKVVDGKQGEEILIQANPLTLEQPVPARTTEEIKAFVAHCRENNEMADYKTEFLMTVEKDGESEEKVFKSIVACNKLGAASALIGKTTSAGASKSKGPSIDDLL